MLHIYWGLGKGKTSTLNGAAIRALGASLKVGFYRFLKGQLSHENTVLKQNNIPVYLFHYSTKFVIEMSEAEKQLTKQAVDKGIQHLIENKFDYDVILIDEFLDLANPNVGMLTETEMIKIIKALEPEKREILLSGHLFLPELFNLADLITHYEATKHYFNLGIKARKGIEF